jgi:hypothetical protein
LKLKRKKRLLYYLTQLNVKSGPSRFISVATGRLCAAIRRVSVGYGKHMLQQWHNAVPAFDKVKKEGFVDGHACHFMHKYVIISIKPGVVKVFRF